MVRCLLVIALAAALAGCSGSHEAQPPYTGAAAHRYQKSYNRCASVAANQEAKANETGHGVEGSLRTWPFKHAPQRYAKAVIDGCDAAIVKSYGQNPTVSNP